MKIFLDTAEINEIKELNSFGLVDGVTTNPSLIAKSGRVYKEVLIDICAEVPGPVSAEVIATDSKEMITEGLELAEIAENIVIKLPMTWDGIKACNELTKRNIDVNVTLCFSASQALIAAKAGAKYISPFVGRHDDICQDGLHLIDEIIAIQQNYPILNFEIIAASLRHPLHIIESAKSGCDIATIPPNVVKKLLNHPLTDIGLKKFLDDWNEASKKSPASKK
jgi:transaldolase